MVMKYLAAAKLLRKQNPRVDNVMFHLHYRITFIIFIISSALITAKEYFGTPINCYSHKYPIAKNVLNTYCFIMSTFSVTKHNVTGPTVVYPGVGEHSEEDHVVYHSYYQWVPAMLFAQAISFYLPRFMWKSFDGGLFSSILMGLNKVCMDAGAIRNKCVTLSRYFISHNNMHRNWAIRFFICELMCLVVVISNIYITDMFLGGTFIEYGADVFRIAEAPSEGRVDHMDKIFPRVAMCTFRKFGTSGKIESNESMCVLAANILIVKIYIFLWYWMMMLAVLTSLWLLYRIVVLAFSGIRSSLLRFRGRLASRDVLHTVGDRATVGDWFLLYHIGRCMHPIDYAAFLRVFAKELNPPNENGPEPSAPAL